MHLLVLLLLLALVSLPWQLEGRKASLQGKPLMLAGLAVMPGLAEASSRRQAVLRGTQARPQLGGRCQSLVAQHVSKPATDLIYHKHWTHLLPPIKRQVAADLDVAA